MKIQTERSEVERSGTQVDSSFTIKATAKSFEILSSSLYADKIRAILRELSCNAYDSHVAAGCPERPIEVFLPSLLNPMFYVKDYGIGLSDADVRGGYRHKDTGEVVPLEAVNAINVDTYERFGGVFNTYFESTKTTSDLFIGQLGLGCKSPYSYASTFNVESRFAGVKTTYVCFKDEDGFPTITPLGSEPSDEHSGMTITLSVRPHDVDKFEVAAKRALMYFSPKPHFTNDPTFAPYRLEHTVSGNGWKVRDSDYYAHANGPYVVQGFVAYPIDVDQMQGVGLPASVTKLLYLDIDIFVPIGQVEVAASRESLSYDRRTVQNLADCLTAISDDLYQSFQNQFDKCKTQWEMASLCAKLQAGGKLRSVFNHMHEYRPFVWNGNPVSCVIQLNLSSVKSTQLNVMKLDRSRRVKRLVTKTSWTPPRLGETTLPTIIDLDLSINVTMLVNDFGKRAHLGSIVAHLSNISGSSQVLLFDSISVPGTKHRRGQCNGIEILNLLADIGAPAPTMVSSIRYLGTQRPKATTTRTPAQRRSTTEHLVWDKARVSGTSTRFAATSWKVEQINLADGGLYIDIDRYTINTPLINRYRFDRVIDAAKRLDLIPANCKIIGLTVASKVKAMKSGGNWVNVIEHIIECFNKSNIGPLYQMNVITGDMFDATVSPAIIEWINQVVSGQPDQPMVDGAMKQAMVEIAEVINKPRLATDRSEDVAQLMREGVVKHDTKKTNAIVSQLNKKWNEAVTCYPMLHHVNWNTNLATTPLTQYVNLVDQSRV